MDPKAKINCNIQISIGRLYITQPDLFHCTFEYEIRVKDDKVDKQTKGTHSDYYFFDGNIADFTKSMENGRAVQAIMDSYFTGFIFQEEW